MINKKPECLRSFESYMGGMFKVLTDKTCYIGINSNRFEELRKVRGMRTVGAFLRKGGYTYLINNELDDNQMMLIATDDTTLGVFPINGKLSI